MKLKKLMLPALSVGMMLSLAACGESKEGETTGTTDTTATAEKKEEPAAAPSETIDVNKSFTVREYHKAQPVYGIKKAYWNAAEITVNNFTTNFADENVIDFHADEKNNQIVKISVSVKNTTELTYGMLTPNSFKLKVGETEYDAFYDFKDDFKKTGEFFDKVIFDETTKDSVFTHALFFSIPKNADWKTVRLEAKDEVDDDKKEMVGVNLQ